MILAGIMKARSLGSECENFKLPFIMVLEKLVSRILLRFSKMAELLKGEEAEAGSR